jgi:hypothetical protein
MIPPITTMKPTRYMPARGTRTAKDAYRFRHRRTGRLSVSEAEVLTGIARGGREWAGFRSRRCILRTASKTLGGRLRLTRIMTKMSPVLRIKAELALVEASRKLLLGHACVRTSPETRGYADTASVVRKELDKLVGILADDTSEKHWNVAARVAKCADYLAQIPSHEVQDARLDMIAAHKVLQDVQEITF